MTGKEEREGAMGYEVDELLAADARHRAANDLAVAAGALRLASRGALSGEGVLAALERIEAAAQLNAALGRRFAGHGVVDLAASFAPVAAALSRVAGAAGWDLSPAIGCALVADRTATGLALVASELVANAVRHARPVGARVISLTLDVVGSGVVLTVAAGRAPPSWIRAGGQGRGIVDALVAGMGGTVRRSTEGAATVKVVVPLARAEARAQPVVRADACTARGLSLPFAVDG